MEFYLNFVVILVAIILVITILLQVKGTSAGLFGGASASFRTRRGVEKALFQFTIFLAIIFIIASILSTRLQ